MNTAQRIIFPLLLASLLAIPLAGCVTKSSANARAKRAYIAGQQAAAARMQRQTEMRGQQPGQVDEGDSGQPLDLQQLIAPTPNRSQWPPVQPQDQSQFMPAQPQVRSQFTPIQPEDQPQFLPAQPQGRSPFSPLEFQESDTPPQTPPAQPPSQAQVVTLSGSVRAPVVLWRGGLTLGQALVNSGDTGSTDPTSITVTRSGRTIRVNPQDLLNGQDMPLLPGDRVDVR